MRIIVVLSLLIILIIPLTLLLVLVPGGKTSSTKVNSTVAVKSDRAPIHWDTKVSPGGLYQGDSFTYHYDDEYNYYQILVTDHRMGSKRVVYRGDFHTLGWDWVTDDKIKIEWDCGTGCIASKVFGIREGLSLADYAYADAMSPGSGWEVQFFKSF